MRTQGRLMQKWKNYARHPGALFLRAMVLLAPLELYVYLVSWWDIY